METKRSSNNSLIFNLKTYSYQPSSPDPSQDVTVESTRLKPILYYY